MWEYDYLPLLRNRDFVIASVGFETGTAKGLNLGTDDKIQIVAGKYLPFRVVRARPFSFAYSWEQDYPNFLPLGPVGVTATTATYQSFLLQNLLPQVNQISNVQNLWLILKNYEAYQSFIGVGPSDLRIFPQQPPNQPTTTMDQNLILTNSFYDEGWYDGRQSPLAHPSEASELLALSGVEPTFSMVNPLTWLLDPVFRIVMNRLVLAPVTDPDFAKKLCLGMIRGGPDGPKTRFIDIGDPFSGVSSITAGNYPGSNPVLVPVTMGS